MSRRVVVTGVGLVSPVGMGTQANWEALCAGTSGIGPITRFDAAAFSTGFAGEVKNFDPLQFIEKKELKKMDIFIQFAVAASQYAMDDAKLTIDAALAPRVGVSYDALGSGKLKLSASWGIFHDWYKYQMSRSAFGGSVWEVRYRSAWS